MSAPNIEALASATGVATETTINDGLPIDPVADGKLASGVPLDGHARINEVLDHVSGAWRVVDTEPRYERTPSPHGRTDIWLARLREAREWHRQRKLERHLAGTSLRATELVPYLPFARMS